MADNKRRHDWIISKILQKDDIPRSLEETDELIQLNIDLILTKFFSLSYHSFIYYIILDSLL